MEAFFIRLQDSYSFVSDDKYTMLFAFLYLNPKQTPVQLWPKSHICFEIKKVEQAQSTGS